MPSGTKGNAAGTYRAGFSCHCVQAVRKHIIVTESILNAPSPGTCLPCLTEKRILLTNSTSDSKPLILNRTREVTAGV